MKTISLDPDYLGILLTTDNELGFEYATFWKRGLNILFQCGIATTCCTVIMYWEY
jgi:hypothetical protein